MAQTKHEIQALLDRAQMRPRHRFGQNFMIDQNVVRLIADSARIGPDNTVIEVGPGTGTLTEELLARAGKVIAFEIDRDLVKLLKERFENNPKLEVVEGDALHGKHELNPELARTCHFSGKCSVKLVANLPYNIASPLIIELLIAGCETLVFTVQKEVADRLRARENDDAYGPLSVMSQMLAKVELLRTISPQVFWPPPKIESALVRMTRDNRLENNAPAFSIFVHQVFSYRRKTLRKALSEAGHDPRVLEALKIDPQARPETLAPEKFLELFDASANSG